MFGQSTLSAGGGGVSISDVGSVASQVSLGQSAFIAGSFLQPEQGLHAYASALQYTAKFGLEEAAQLLADEENLLTSQLLKDAINGVW
ncbi:MAG: hypothetical protein K2W93_16835, partial [Burkholderiaceae bacterium]|nr:hypothetical protein [Burkholderiaceae bacterium]